MDSFQKRDRQRRKLQKRKDKEVKRKERAEAKLHPRPEFEPETVPSDEAVILAVDEPSRLVPREEPHV